MPFLHRSYKVFLEHTRGGKEYLIDGTLHVTITDRSRAGSEPDYECDYDFSSLEAIELDEDGDHKPVDVSQFSDLIIDTI